MPIQPASETEEFEFRARAEAEAAPKPAAKAPMASQPSTLRSVATSAFKTLNPASMGITIGRGIMDMAAGDSLSPIEQVGMHQHDTLEEKVAYLSKVKGKDNVRVSTAQGSGKQSIQVKDSKGRWTAAQEGFFPSLAADAPEIAGMTMGETVGGVAGARFGPAGVALGGALGSGAGAGAVKASEELHQFIAGDKKLTGKDLGIAAGEVAGSIEGGIVASPLGKVGEKIVNRLISGPLPKWFTQVTDATKAEIDRLTAGGAQPAIKSFAPGLRYFARIQALSNIISGPPKASNEANVAFVQREVKSALLQSGVDPAHIAAAVKELDNPGSRMSTRDVGEKISASIQAKLETHAQAIETLADRARTKLDESLGRIQAVVNKHPVGALGTDVPEALSNARVEFGKDASALYDEVDKISAGMALYPSKSATQAAQDLLAKLPESDANKPIIKAIAEWDGRIPFAQAQRARTQLFEISQSANMTPNATKHEYSEVAKAIDDGFAAAAANDGPGFAARGSAAAKALERADQFYAEGIAKFKEAKINHVVATMKAGLASELDPAEIAHQLIIPGRTGLVKTVRELMGDKLFSRVARQDLSNILSSSIDPVTKRITASSLTRELSTRGNLIKEVHGTKTANDLWELARGHEVLGDAKLDPAELLKPNGVRTALTRLRTEEKALDDFMTKDPLRALAKPGRTPEAVYAWMVRPEKSAPGMTSRLRSAVQHFGADSPTIKAIQQQATKNILNSSVKGAAEGKSSTALLNSLARYSPEQKAILFPHGMADDLDRIGRDINLLFTSKGDLGMPGMAGGHILGQKFYHRWADQAGMAIYNTILRDPRTIRYLAIGLEGDGPIRNATLKTLRTMIQQASLEGNRPDETPPTRH